MKWQSIFLKTNALLMLITAAACLVAVVQLWVGYQVSKNSQRIKSYELPVAVGSMSMRGALADLNANLLEYTLGEPEEKAEYYENLTKFKRNRARMPVNSRLEEELTRVDFLVSQMEMDVEERVFGVYDPKKEQQARTSIARLQRDVGEPLEFLLEGLKSDEVSDATTGDSAGRISLDDFIGLQLYLELSNTASDMLSDLDRFVLTDVTAKRAFFEHALNFEVLLARLKPLERKPEEIVSIREIERLFKELKSGGVSVFSLHSTADYTDALKVLDDLEHTGSQESLQALDQLADQSRSAVQEKISSLGDLVFRSNVIMLSCLALAIGLALFGTMFVRRRIIVPVGVITELISQLRQGRRDIAIDMPKKEDELSGILKALDEFQSELRELDQLREHQVEQYKELKARELQLQSKSSALEAANLDLEQFVHIASHDMREPLKQISGLAELLEFQTEDLQDGEVKESVSRIQNCSIRMCELIDDLRALTRVNSTPLEMKPCDLGALLASVLAANDQLVCEREARVHTEILPVVNCNAGLIQQVFESLLQNALSHGSSPLQINITTSSLDEKGVTFVFSNTCASDNMDGARLLLPFVRGYSSCGKGVGTGMGLAICKKIVDVHGGNIKVEALSGWFRVYVQIDAV